MPHSQRSSRARSGAACIASFALILSGSLAAGSSASAAIVPDPIQYSAQDPGLSLAPVGTHQSGVFDESAAEIVQAYGDRLFVVDAQAGSVRVLDWSDPAAMTEDFALSSDGVANSLAIRADGLGVIAFEASVKTDPGHLVFFDANATDAASAVLGEVVVGALPDMVTISKDGAYAVVANEAEPADDFTIDPEGSIGVVSLPAALAAPTQDAVATADFHEFEAGGTKTLPEDVRVFGPRPHEDFPVSRNLEPEYITVVDGTAYAALQEANAIAVVDLATAEVTDILPLGFTDLGLAQNALDPSDKDAGYALRTFPGLKGIYMPDGLQSYTAGGQTYLVTANEGDAREWGDYVEGTRVKSIAKDGYGPVCATSPLAAQLGDADLGRLNVTTENGFDAEAGCYDELYAFGGRSFSIWTTDGIQVFDSGSQFEEITHAAAPEFFNSNHTESVFEGRGDDKGPEPENVTIGELSGRTYAFIGFERVGGIAVYDITDLSSSEFVTYVNNRDFSVSVEDGGDLAAAGDLGPEGIVFIPATQSPTGTPVIVTGNEVSGTTTVFEITDNLALANVTAPTIAGSPDVTRTLTASSGTWNMEATFAYQWLRDGQPITGATAAAYRVRLADQGREVSVRVTATASGATVSADSAAVTIRYAAVATVTAGSLSVSAGKHVTVTVRVLATAGARADGPVTVKVAGKSVTGTATNGIARVEVGVVPRGIHAITVAYAGSATVSPTVGLGVVVVR